MLLATDTTFANIAGRLADRLAIQNPHEIVQTAQKLLCTPNDQDPAWRARAMLEIATLQQLIQKERYWLTNLQDFQDIKAPKTKRHLHELINETMTCLLSLEFALSATQGQNTP